ncbi:HNH endonuclease signature motif containing protein [Alicyclobacillus sp. ALC3]|uniref:HNH endonuclease signature motif containing protein n=1 Tax=Alicyclobacillus sp. ALC3 TaxID=2796143 RepID=UPI0023790501|nr:HNH endonuclease signature motif containing protein [Alicyclobacillus sp. ALC3]WDL96917.1 HNH endonuclease [Alicyclobacillus sp. ALC3]
MFRYSQEQREFIQANVSGRLVSDLTDMFNAHFGASLKYEQLRAFVKNNGLKSGVDSRFKPGTEPSNKGKPKMWAGGEATQFRKGDRPHNYMPVGSERVNTDGYVDIKIADPNQWRGKHLIEWERYNGRPVPEGYVVLFGDRDHFNFEPDNLILVSRAQLAIMNKRKLIQDDADLTRSGALLADIYHKIGQRKRNG